MSNPEFEAYGSKRMQWQEDLGSSELRDANEFLQDSGYGSLKRITGYYCESFQHETAVPAVRVHAEACPRCGGTGTDPKDDGDCELCDATGDASTYQAAVRDPNNDGAAVVDLEDTFTDPAEAARAAHRLAERYAESAREDDAKFQAEQQTETALEDIRTARREHSALTRELNAWVDLSKSPHLVAASEEKRAALRRQVDKAAKRIRALRDNYWTSVES